MSSKTQVIYAWPDGDWRHEHDTHPFFEEGEKDCEPVRFEVIEHDDYTTDQAYLQAIVPLLIKAHFERH